MPIILLKTEPYFLSVKSAKRFSSGYFSYKEQVELLMGNGGLDRGSTQIEDVKITPPTGNSRKKYEKWNKSKKSYRNNSTYDPKYKVTKNPY